MTRDHDTGIGPQARSSLRLVAILLVFYCSSWSLAAQATGEGLGSLRSVRPMLIGITFEGNTAFSDEQLLIRIQSRATEFDFIDRYARIAVDVPIVPGPAKWLLYKTADSLGEISYLNLQTVREDSSAIIDAYDDIGHHRASVRYRVGIDTSENIAALHFIIDEGPRYVVRGVRVDGIESLSPDLGRQVRDITHLEEGEPYTVQRVNAELTRILAHLRNNGYPFATEPRPPIVIKYYPPDYEEYSDSVILYVYPDQRYRFGETVFRQVNASVSKPVDSALLAIQLDYKPGEWYSARKVAESRANLYRLGSFDLVRLDTNSRLTGGDTLGMRASLRIRDLNEIEIAPEISNAVRGDERTTYLGLNARYSRLNLLGRSTRASIGGQIQFRPLLTGGEFFREPEYSANFRLEWPNPFLAKRLNAAGALSAAEFVDDKAGDAVLKNGRYTATAELSYSLPSYVFINAISIRANFQHNGYQGIDDYLNAQVQSRLGELSGECDTGAVRADVLRTLARSIYRIQVLQGDDLSLARQYVSGSLDEGSFADLKRTYVVGGSFSGDTRNDFFAPSDGYYFQGNGDIGVTGGVNGWFVRLEADVRQYLSVGLGDVFAWRGHFGTVGQIGEFPLTPISYRFWSGGANSMRGWGPREMLVTTPPETENVDSCAVEVVENILAQSRRLLGGLGLGEMSAEYRTRLFGNAATNADVELRSPFIGILFVDLGGAFFRSYRDDAEITNVGSVLSNLGLNVGAAIGYDTPLGPIRLGAGYRIYDPIDRTPGTRFVWQHPPSLADVSFHFGIGHAF